jgi:hypothetical protein
MTGNVALDVVISLVFIYLLYSLLATTINEAIASIFNLRAKKLEKAITRMLEDTEMSYDNFWTFIWDYLYRIWEKLKSFFMFFSFKKREKTKENISLVESFYNYPGIKYLAQNKISNKPSYISPEFFSKALTDILKERAGNPNKSNIKQIQDGLVKYEEVHDKIENAETMKFIQSLLADANNDIEKFKAGLETWFNETMKRTTGWYKKQSQRITFIIGLVLAVTFNVDTISIVKKLSNDPNAAKSLADLSAKYVEAHKDSTGRLIIADQDSAARLFAEAKKQVDEDINNANSIIGLGWNIPQNTCNCTKNALISKQDSSSCKTCLIKISSCSIYKTKNKKGISILNTLGKVRYVICMACSSGRRLLGYLLTALALSLGAPFWFDLLNKLIMLRGSISNKATSASSGKKDKKTNNNTPAVG